MLSADCVLGDVFGARKGVRVEILFRDFLTFFSFERPNDDCGSCFLQRDVFVGNFTNFQTIFFIKYIYAQFLRSIGKYLLGNNFKSKNINLRIGDSPV